MKKKILLCCFIGLNAGCSIQPERPAASIHSISVALVVDLTDKKKLWPLPDPVLELFHCDNNPDAACHFSMQVISNKQINPSSSCKLPDAAATEKENRYDDIQYRNKSIVGFYSCVRKTFADFYTQFDTTKSLDHSECWSTICTALQKMALEKSDKKYLLIYSDLLEWSDAENAYQSLSTTGIETIAERLNHASPVPQNLQSITVIIVYEPKNRDDDKKFNKMLQVYKFLLEKKGAQVLVQANNTNYGL